LVGRGLPVKLLPGDRDEHCARLKGESAATTANPKPASRYLHKNIRLHPARYIGRLMHFITICCEHRRSVFTVEKRALWLIGILKRHSTRHGFAVDAYCVMPNHFHALVTGLHSRCNLLAFVKHFKQTTSRIYRRRTGRTLWQKKFFDHILKPSDNALGVRGYIWMNPVRKGLCKDPRVYPYSGSAVVGWKNEISPIEEWKPSWKRVGGNGRSSKAPD
jgi:putative transposase